MKGILWSRPALLSVACALTLSACGSTPAPTPLSVTGTWLGHVEADTSGVKLVLIQDGDAVTGTFSSASRSTPNTFRLWGNLTGRLDGRTLTLQVVGDPVEHPNATATFLGIVEGNRYDGNVTTVAGESVDTTPFTTQKQ